MDQSEANDLVMQDLDLALGLEGTAEIDINEDLDGNGPAVAVCWSVMIHSDVEGPLRLSSGSPSVELSGVTIVHDRAGQLRFERHIDWLDYLAKLGYAMSSRKVGVTHNREDEFVPI